MTVQDLMDDLDPKASDFIERRDLLRMMIHQDDFSVCNVAVFLRMHPDDVAAMLNEERVLH